MDSFFLFLFFFFLFREGVIRKWVTSSCFLQEINGKMQVPSSSALQKLILHKPENLGGR